MIATTSCTKENDIPELKRDKSSAPVEYRNNMLVFDSEKTLLEVLSDKQEIPHSTTFCSQKEIFDRIIDAEYEHALGLRDLSDEEYNECQIHSDLYLEKLDESFIKETYYTDGTSLYDLNLAFPAYAKILNEEGYFAIQDTIFQMTANEILAWEGCKDLADVNKTNYKVRYSDLQTKADHIILDQEVIVANSLGNDRAIVALYDNTTLNTSATPPSFVRQCYVRSCYQEKVDGRNYSYVDKYFLLDGSFDVQKNGETTSNEWEFVKQDFGGNEWYTVYFDLEFVNPGKQDQSFSSQNQISHILGFYLGTQYTIGDTKKLVTFSGIRTDSEYMDYTIGSYQRLTTLPD